MTTSVSEMTLILHMSSLSINETFSFSLVRLRYHLNFPFSLPLVLRSCDHRIRHLDLEGTLAINSLILQMSKQAPKV